MDLTRARLCPKLHLTKRQLSLKQAVNHTSVVDSKVFVAVPGTKGAEKSSE